MPTPHPSPYPHLSPRALGWLNFLHQKATTPDDWSEDGEPHEWWDQTSTDPMCSFPRFDLQESTYAIGLMADQTPAWREVYAQILNEISERFLTYWAAVDWLTQFGPDPRRKTYPPEWKGFLIPEEFWGDYDAPGWTANGIAPWGLQPDPIGADGNLFFKGWLNLTQSLHAYVTGEDKWGQGFMMAGVERARFSWTQHSLVEHLAHQWGATPMGPHCENTKVWPFCLSAAGLGLMMYDNLFAARTHDAYTAWLDHTKDTYYGFDDKGILQWVALYYDPHKEHVHMTVPTMGLAIAFYALPQAPEFAEKLYRAAIAFTQWDNPAQPITEPPIDPRLMVLGLTMAKELGDYATEARLRAYAETHFEPKYFGENDAHFGFWFGFGENWPRGQLSALAICADVGAPGAWADLFRKPNLAKFDAPTLEGVDYPALGVAQAWNDPTTGTLHIQVFDGNEKKSGKKTRFSVSNLPNVKDVHILCDGDAFDAWKEVGAGKIEIATDIGAHNFQIYTGYRSDEKTARARAKKGLVRAAASASLKPKTGKVKTAPTAGLLLPPSAGCPCCASVPSAA